MVIYFVKLDNNKQYIFDITCTVILYMYLLPPTTDEHYKDRDTNNGSTKSMF